MGSRSAERTLFVKFLGETPLAQVLDFLIENDIFDYTKTEIAKNSGVSRTSLYKIWPILEYYEIVKESRKIANTKLYRLNKKNPIVKKLLQLDLLLSKTMAEKVEAKYVMVAREK